MPRQGRLPSIILQSTTPISGIWIPPRNYAPIQRHRKWTVTDSGDISWEPQEPDGGIKKVDAIGRIAEEVRRKKTEGPSAILRFSGTSKTGITWSLPPVASCPNIDETCGSCYALDGFYRTNIAAQVNRVLRLEYLRNLIASGSLAIWIDWMVAAMGRLRPVEAVPERNLDSTLKMHLDGCALRPAVFFRWHDSGDLFHADYARAVFEVARRTPSVLHWIPTRMGGLVARLVSEGEVLPANLAVQISCHHGGSLESAQHAALRTVLVAQPDARIGLTYSMAGPKNRALPPEAARAAFGEQAKICPATVALRSEDRTCQGCRRCWGTATPESILIYATHHGD